MDFDYEVAVYYDPDLAWYEYPLFTLQIGANHRTGGCASDTDEIYDADAGRWVYRLWCGYTVRWDDFDPDGFSVPANALWEPYGVYVVNILDPTLSADLRHDAFSSGEAWAHVNSKPGDTPSPEPTPAPRLLRRPHPRRPRPESWA